MMPKIMIVEDEWVIAENLQNILKNKGYSVSSIVTKGENVLEEVKNSPPDLILMDIKLNGKMDGVDVANLIKKNNNIPIIFTTAYSNEQIIQRAKFTESYGYIIKPYDKQELYATIEMALYKHNIDKQLKENEGILRIVTDISRDWEYWYHPKQGFIYVSPSCEDITGYSQEEFSKDPKILEKIIHPEDINQYNKFLKQTLTDIGKSSIEFRIIKKNGDIRFIEQYSNPVIGKSGENYGIRVSNRDVTIRKEFEKEIHTLRNILPICSSCRKIRDEKGFWHQVEEYLRQHSDIRFTHGICDDCIKKLYPDIAAHLDSNEE